MATTSIAIRFPPIFKPKFNLYRSITLEMGSQTPTKRPTCPSCTKPIRLCLCSRFKTPLFNNPISVTILQHNHEKNHPLNSTRIAALGLKNLTVTTVSDVHLEAKFLIYLLNPGFNDERLDLEALDEDLEDTQFGGCRKSGKRLKLETLCEEEADISATMEKCGYNCTLMRLRSSNITMDKPDFDKLADSQVGKDAIANGFIVRKLHKDQLGRRFDEEDSEEYTIVVPPRAALLFPAKKSINVDYVGVEVKHLVVLDGTWAKAKRMYHENPWLKLLPHLKLDLKQLSLYSEVRQQPKLGCLSTIESIVSAMKALGADCQELDNLLDVFESMVVDQRRCKDERLNKPS